MTIDAAHRIVGAPPPVRAEADDHEQGTGFDRRGHDRRAGTERRVGFDRRVGDRRRNRDVGPSVDYVTPWQLAEAFPRSRPPGAGPAA